MIGLASGHSKTQKTREAVDLFFLIVRLIWAQNGVPLLLMSKILVSV
jgi:hypothetical protein